MVKTLQPKSSSGSSPAKVISKGTNKGTKDTNLTKKGTKDTNLTKKGTVARKANIRNPTMLFYVECIERIESWVMRISYASPEHFLVSCNNERPFLVRFVQSTENVHRRKVLTLKEILERPVTRLSNFDDDGTDDSVEIRLLFSEKITNESDLSQYAPLGDIPEYGEDVPDATRNRFFDLARKKFGVNYFNATGKTEWYSLSSTLLWSRMQDYVQEHSFSSLGVGMLRYYPVDCSEGKDKDPYRWCKDVLDNYDKLRSGERRIM